MIEDPTAEVERDFCVRRRAHDDARQRSSGEWVRPLLLSETGTELSADPFTEGWGHGRQTAREILDRLNRARDLLILQVSVVQVELTGNLEERSCVAFGVLMNTNSPNSEHNLTVLYLTLSYILCLLPS